MAKKTLMLSPEEMDLGGVKLKLAPSDVPVSVTYTKNLPQFGGGHTYEFAYPGGKGENTPSLLNLVEMANGKLYTGVNSGRIWQIRAKSLDHAIDAVMESLRYRRYMKAGAVMNHAVIHKALESLVR